MLRATYALRNVTTDTGFYATRPHRLPKELVHFREFHCVTKRHLLDHV